MVVHDGETALVPARLLRRRRDHAGRQLPDPLEGARDDDLARPGDPLPDDDLPQHYAIHGFPSVPTYPASHGCVRIPIWIADWLYQQSPVGERVYVYE